MLFHREASLFAQPFDPKKPAFGGEPVHVAGEVQSNPANGRGNFDVSQNGVLLYFQGAADAAGGRGLRPGTFVSFAWFDRTGKQVAATGEPAAYGDMDISPDGKLIPFPASCFSGERGGCAAARLVLFPRSCAAYSSQNALPAATSAASRHVESVPSACT